MRHGWLHDVAVQVPHAAGAIHTRGEQEAPLCADVQRRHLAAVPAEQPQLLARQAVPHDDGAVAVGRDGEAAPLEVLRRAAAALVDRQERGGRDKAARAADELREPPHGAVERPDGGVAGVRGNEDVALAPRLHRQRRHAAAAAVDEREARGRRDVPDDGGAVVRRRGAARAAAVEAKHRDVTGMALEHAQWGVPGVGEEAPGEDGAVGGPGDGDGAVERATDGPADGERRDGRGVATEHKLARAVGQAEHTHLADFGADQRR